MDPLSQAVVGAVFAQNVVPKKLIRNNGEVTIATVTGILAGIAPDLDVLIKSSTDPLLAIEYHRHFTHSLIFAPVLAALVALFMYWIKKRSLPFKRFFLYALFGAVSHGLLDACTSYGTQLFWPFSDTRVAWNNVSIIDPLFTIPLLVMILFQFKKPNLTLPKISAFYMVLFLLFGLWQNIRATRILGDLAQTRGHKTQRLESKPSFGNLWLWRGLYETTDGIFYVDAIWTLPGMKHKIYEGDSVKRWRPEIEIPELESRSVLADDIQRFAWFSDNYLAPHPEDSTQIGDLRYATLPNSIYPLWALEVRKETPDHHAPLNYFSSTSHSEWQLFKRMLLRQ